MNEFTQKLKEFEHSIYKIYNAADIGWSQLEHATSCAANLIEQIKFQAQNNKNLKLQAFMLSILASLRLLQEITVQSQAEISEIGAENAESLQTVMQNLAKVYHDHIEPVIGEIQQQAQSGRLGEVIGQATMFAALGNEVIGCANEIIAFRDNMNTKEKITAALGVIMMFAGLGLLLAATINPATAPVIVPLVIISLGCYLCRRSVQRLKDENNHAAMAIDKKLDKTANVVDNVTSAFKQINPARMFLFFSSGPTPESVTHNIQVLERKLNVLDARINKIKQKALGFDQEINKWQAEITSNTHPERVLKIVDEMKRLRIKKEDKEVELEALEKSQQSLSVEITKLKTYLADQNFSTEGLRSNPVKFASKLANKLRSFFKPLR